MAYNFLTLNYPGASGTGGRGINDAGEVVGAFTSMGSSGPSSLGFTYQNGVFAAVTYPTQVTPGESTAIVGVADSGILVGSTTNITTNFNSEAFTDEDGTFSTLPYPSGSNMVYPSGVNPAGTVIVGSYQEGRYSIGFTYTNGLYKNISFPGYGTDTGFTTSNHVNGTNSAGALVGSYGYAGGNLHGFYDTGGVFSSLDFPGAASTSATGINAADEIVGSYTDASGVSHGFVDLGGTFTSVDLPGATSTSVNGINDAGTLVGTATINGADTAFTATLAVCFAAGTLIRTTNGDRAIETLTVGDEVVTTSGAHRPICWLGHRIISTRHHSRPENVMPIRISAHAFGESRPARDLWLSPGHAICVDAVGEILIPAAALVNGATITREDVDAIAYWHIELATHDILLAENLHCESYCEMGNRAFFAEAQSTALHAAPDAQIATHAAFCRPFYQQGPIVDFVRSRLAENSAALGWSLEEVILADHICLLVDGKCLVPEVNALALRFLLPANAKQVLLISTTGVPAWVGCGLDLRELGICIDELVIDDGFSSRTIPADDPLLCKGFYQIEEGPQRWTTGRALLPLALWEDCRSSFFLRVNLARPLLPRRSRRDFELKPREARQDQRS